MAASKTLSPDNQMYYRHSLRAILAELTDGKQVYTHHFEYLGLSSISRDRPLLRKCLRTLEAQGFIENINLGFNIHQWKITEAGKQELNKPMQ